MTVKEMDALKSLAKDTKLLDIYPINASGDLAVPTETHMGTNAYMNENDDMKDDDKVIEEGGV